MSLCGLFHDMGKNKQAFSDYLQADENVRQKLMTIKEYDNRALSELYIPAYYQQMEYMKKDII